MATASADQLIIGARLRAVRDALGLRQRELAASIGEKRTTLANWEAGRVLPGVRAMMRLFLTHGVTLEWVYLGLLRDMPEEIAGFLALRARLSGAVPPPNRSPNSGARAQASPFVGFGACRTGNLQPSCRRRTRGGGGHPLRQP